MSLPTGSNSDNGSLRLFIQPKKKCRPTTRYFLEQGSLVSTPKFLSLIMKADYYNIWIINVTSLDHAKRLVGSLNYATGQGLGEW